MNQYTWKNQKIHTYYACNYMLNKYVNWSLTTCLIQWRIFLTDKVKTNLDCRKLCSTLLTPSTKTSPNTFITGQDLATIFTCYRTTMYNKFLCSKFILKISQYKCVAEIIFQNVARIEKTIIHCDVYVPTHSWICWRVEFVQQKYR